MGLLFAEIQPCERAQVMPFLALVQVCFTAVFIASCQKHIYCQVRGYHSGVYERLQSSGMWHHVNWYEVISVLEEPAATIFKVTVSKESLQNLMMDATTFSTALVPIHQPTQCHIPEYLNLHTYNGFITIILWVSQPLIKDTPGYCLMNPEELPKYCHDNEGSSW